MGRTEGDLLCVCPAIFSPSYCLKIGEVGGGENVCYALPFGAL